MSRPILNVILFSLAAWMMGCHADGPRINDVPAEDMEFGEPGAASLFGEPITRAELRQAAADKDRSEAYVLGTMIASELVRRYQDEQGIHVTDQEISDIFDQFKAMGFFEEAYMHDVGAAIEVPDALEDVPEEEQRDLRDFFSMHMLRWKTDKALYEQYGGEVVFQRFNPLEPLGAYRAFLEEHERKGSFAIYDDDLREGFWAFYRTDNHTVFSPEDVDFSRPWWEQEHDDDCPHPLRSN